jgi:hypothetical protein
MPHFIATYTDGSTFEGGLTDGSFGGIDQDRLRSFRVLYEGLDASLDMVTGVFTINGESQYPPIPPNPRLIAYATMRGYTNSIHPEEMYAFVIGWQATAPVDGAWRNIKFGLRVIPSELRWELTEDI